DAKSQKALNRRKEWMKKMWNIYTMEYHSAVKPKDIMKCAGKWMELENIILSEISALFSHHQNDFHQQQMETDLQSQSQTLCGKSFLTGNYHQISPTQSSGNANEEQVARAFLERTNRNTVIYYLPIKIHADLSNAGVFSSSRTGVFSSCCLALDSSSSFPCPAFRAIAKSALSKTERKSSLNIWEIVLLMRFAPQFHPKSNKGDVQLKNCYVPERLGKGLSTG
ncbi:hypothetical protein STEG23_037030, partial [Scotinomys teguina]